MADDCVTSSDMERDAVLNLRLPSEVKEALRRAGDDDHGRSVSGMAVKAMREWLAERNYLSIASEPQPRRSPAGPKTKVKPRFGQWESVAIGKIRKGL